MRRPIHTLSTAWSACLAGLALAASWPVHAEDFWCGDKIITNGMTTFQIKAACGAPVEIRSRQGERHRRSNGYGQEEAYYDPPGELWTYNFGSTRLMQRLLFVNGILVETTSLQYGYDP